MSRQNIPIFIIAILFLIGIGAYFYARNSYLSSLKSTQQACTEDARICPDGSSVGRTGPNCDFAPCPTSVTPSAMPTTQQVPAKGYALYTNSIAHYKVEYPNNWSGGTSKTNRNDFSINSPDYKMNSGYPYLETGASLAIYATSSRATDLKQYINNDPLLKQIAKNVIETTLAGLPAIQFDFSYEGTNATMTIAIDGNITYNVRFNYADSQTKAKYLPLYQHMLDTFSITRQ